MSYEELKDQLETRFRCLIEDGLGIKGKREIIEAWYDELIRAYTGSDRHYHDINHIIDCLNEFDKVKQNIQYPSLMELAIWFHDYVYDTRKSDNEEQSAYHAVNFIADLGMDRMYGMIVQSLIMYTKHCFEPIDDDARYIMDIDLVGFGKSDDIVQRNNANVRAEYNWVDEVVYRKNRRFILKKFLGKAEAGQLYKTEYFNKLYGERALENLSSSVEELNVPERGRPIWMDQAAEEFTSLILAQNLGEKTKGEWEDILAEIIKKYHKE